MAGKITVPELRARKATAGRGEKIAMVTAYDATFARMLDAAGVDAMLVGDSLGMVIQGGTSTLPVTLDEIIYHGRAVVRGTQRAHVIGDMPFMSYQAGSTRPSPTPGA
jgi:3-methyl-2-oxobutanoate hydroxymethyltransferase